LNYNPYYIADFDQNTGLETYHESFLVPEKAFPIIEDAYCWRGRIKRREGFTHLGRLRRVLTAVPMGNIQKTGATNTFNLAALMVPPVTELNAELEQGTAASPLTISMGVGIFIKDVTGNGSTLTISGLPAGTTATINYITWDLIITWGPGAFGAHPATVTGAYFPSLPVMGLRRQETVNINAENLIAFDTTYAYRIIGGVFSELPSTLPVTWTGGNSDFFWSTNYWNSPISTASPQKLFWVTNFHSSDPMRFYNGTTWKDFQPILAPNTTIANSQKILTARIIIPFKGALLLMNTFEGLDDTNKENFQNRIRFNQIASDPTIDGVLNGSGGWTTISSWADNPYGYGGFINLPTSEQITSAAFIKDTLLVKCERSSYKLNFTGIRQFPFSYEKINTELGCGSTFSPVRFDNGVLTVGNYGITQDDSVSVVKIDQMYPQYAFEINNANDGSNRVQGIRDYFRDLALWIYPNSASNPTFPNKMLVYNYKNNSFSRFNDYFTCLGYYQNPSGLTWAKLDKPPWNYKTWIEWTAPWNSSASQSQFPDIAAGNQQGYVAVLFKKTGNDISLSISKITFPGGLCNLKVVNHNLPTGTYIKVTGIVGTTDFTTINNKIYQISVVDANNFTIDFKPIATPTPSNYFGGGRVTVIQNINIQTKIFTPGYAQGSKARLGHIDFLLDKTSVGQITSNVYIDENNTLTQSSPGSTGNLGFGNIVLTSPENSTLIPYQSIQSKIWHRQYVQSICQNFQIQISFSDAQMRDESIATSSVVLHALVMYISKNSRLVQ
jgi:hypothetical protein